MTKTLAYYPGCSLHGTSGEFDASFKATARALDLVLQEIPGWECCGNTAAHSINRLLSTALPVNELAKVEQDMKLDAVAVPCAACYSRFKAPTKSRARRRRPTCRRPRLQRRRRGRQPHRRLPRRRGP
jgi:heterodisulfide reductase subunit B